MIKRLTQPPAALLVNLLLLARVHACPVCNSETGEKIRQEIFNGEFMYHVLLLLAPFAAVFSLLMWIGYGPPVRMPGFDRMKPRTSPDTLHETRERIHRA